jgi:ribonuclease BN (tRNA processing enzyme)
VTEVVFIGTSDAFGAGGRRQSATLLRGRRGTLLLDCAATSNSGFGELGIERDEIDAIVVSHFHGDHFAGIPLLLLAAIYEDERRRPLLVAGPPGVESRVRELARAMGHPVEDSKLGFPLRFRELTVGGVHDLGAASVRAFATRHQLEANPQGYQLDLGGTRVVYSGDTGWFDELPRLAGGADLFVCECTFHETDFEFHLNLRRLVERRGEFDCGRIVLTHLGTEMTHRRGQCAYETADDGLTLKL